MMISLDTSKYLLDSLAFSKYTLLPVLENRFGSNDMFMIKKTIALDLFMHDGH